MEKFNEEIKILTTIFINNFKFYGILTSKRKPLVRLFLNKWNKNLSLISKKTVIWNIIFTKKSWISIYSNGIFKSLMKEKLKF